MQLGKKLGSLVVLTLVLVTLVGCFGGKKQISGPKNVTIKNHLLTWEQDEQVDKYIIKIDDLQAEVTGKQYDLTKFDLLAGEYQVSIIAVKGKSQSNGVKIAYQIQALSSDDVFEIQSAIMKMINPNFTLDLNADDFADEMQYQQYQIIKTFAEVFTHTWNKFGLEKEQALTFIQDGAKLLTLTPGNKTSSMTNLLSFMKQLEANYGLTGYRLGYLMVKLADPVLSLTVMNYEHHIAIGEARREMDYNSISTIINSTEYKTFINTLNNYLNDTELLILRQIIESSRMRLSGLSSEDILNYNGENYPQEVLIFIELISKVYATAYAGGDQQTVELLEDDNTYNLLHTLSGHFYSYEHLSKQFVSNSIRKDELADLHAVIVRDQKDLIPSMEVALNYAIKVISTLDLNKFVPLLGANANLTPQAIMMMKDEIVRVLQAAMPSMDEYRKIGKLYELVLYYITKDPQSYQDYMVDDLYYLQVIGLDLLKHIDATTIQKIFNLKNVSEKDIVKTVVELIVHLDSLWKNVDHGHQDMIDSMRDHAPMYEQLMGKVMLKTLYYYLDGTNLPIDTWNQMQYIYEKQFNLYPELLKIGKRLGQDVYDLFIETEGQFFIEVYDLLYMLQAGRVGEIEPQNLAGLLSGILSYYDVTLANMTLDEWTTLVQYISYQLMSNLLLGTNVNLEVYYQAIDHIAPKLATVAMKLTEVVEKVIREFEQQGYLIYVIGATDPMEVIYYFVLTLDQVFTNSFEQEFISAIKILFREVLSEPTLTTLLGINPTDADALQTVFINTLGTIFSELHRIADKEYESLTPADFETILSLINFIN